MKHVILQASIYILKTKIEHYLGSYICKNLVYIYIKTYMNHGSSFFVAARFNKRPQLPQVVGQFNSNLKKSDTT